MGQRHPASGRPRRSGNESRGWPSAQAAAVIVLPGVRIPGVDDFQGSPNAAEREHLAGEIKRTALAWSVSFAEVSEIDTINIYWASQLAMKRAVAGTALCAQDTFSSTAGA